MGTLLASIGVPLLLNALTGKGLQDDQSDLRYTKNVYVPKNGKGKPLGFESNPLGIFINHAYFKVRGRGKKKAKTTSRFFCK